MRKTIVLLTVALLAGCAATPDATVEPPVPPTTTVPPTTVAPPTTTLPAPVSVRDVEAAFLEDIRDESWTLPSVTWVDVASDDQLLEFAEIVCGAFGDGLDFTLVSLLTIQAGVEQYGSAWTGDDDWLVGYGIASAVIHFCPTFLQDLQDELDAYGV